MVKPCQENDTVTEENDIKPTEIPTKQKHRTCCSKIFRWFESHS